MLYQGSSHLVILLRAGIFSAGDQVEACKRGLGLGREAWRLDREAAATPEKQSALCMERERMANDTPY